MLRDFVIIIALFFILISILIVFNARKIAKKKFKTVDENVATKNIKITFYIFIVVLLMIIYYISR